MKLYNQYPTPMGVMRHEVAERIDTHEKIQALWNTLTEPKEVSQKVDTPCYTIADAKKIVRDGDLTAFWVGLGVLLAIAVFTLYLLVH